jgi:hypothetical protein
MPPAIDAHLVIHAVALATVLLIAAFFILVTAERSIGFGNIFGKLLAIWLFLIAMVVVAGAATAPKFGGKPFGLDLPMHEGAAPQPAPTPVPAEEPPAEAPPVELEPAPSLEPPPSGSG